MSNPISNASGVYSRTGLDLFTMLYSGSGTMITKSCTYNTRVGNEGLSYWENNQISINSMGLPNYGYKFYTEFINNKTQPKHCFLSIANINNHETGEILKYINDKDYISYPEINVSCPNIVGKEQLGYNYKDLEDFLTNIVDKTYTKPYGLKLPPYFDPVHFKHVAEIISRHPNITYLTCINSVGNALEVNIEEEAGVIKPKNGLGGLGGNAILPVALSNIYQFKQLLPNLDIIGCGGINSGEDIFKHILVGATFVQIGTALHRNGIIKIKHLTDELRQIMIEKNYKTLDDFRGKYNEFA